MASLLPTLEAVGDRYGLGVLGYSRLRHLRGSMNLGFSNKRSFHGA
ncbi:hypothetical protein [Vacuolonema iberomarrocanum]|nr:hypothetical protein [filamentous cyanobacterium LEGE 07170]